ncbi:MAG: DUF4832 domain-containing protein, partial [Lachnospiraceae bacterium]|nr:DUF4832 domain-containing protein [Lachnospiraceae bacterium]
MKRNIKILTSLITIFALLVTGVYTVPVGVRAEEGIITAHTVEKGDSYEGNPLKGFVAYSDSVSFPVSMEWFYISVRDVQTGMNTFNWSALEKKLNAVASRGHQAVFRFYYDYPNEPTGIPQFLLDGGLQTKYYSDQNDIGGDGYCPDYTNQNFKQSMINFIREFGKNYDGDGRIAYITVGLLGFWGEWHNYPFDDKWSNEYDSFFVVPTSLQKDVLNEFDNAFNITKLCVREPKSGIDYSKLNIGFHDDSFAYATLSTLYGGQDWSFMSKMRTYGTADIWKRECIGGEIYPPSQSEVYSGNMPQNNNFQEWSKCLEEAHPTWMLNDMIKSYKGTSLQNAKKASIEMGYDLQVDKSYYKDICHTGEAITLGVDINNIGVAPFYYDHRTWPVEISVMKNNSVVATKTTSWDLNTIQSKGKIYFQDEFDAGLPEGEYDFYIRVINPISNGSPLKFANKYMGSDGRLKVGHFSVVNQQTTETSTEIQNPTQNETTQNNSGETDNELNKEYKAWQDEEYIYVNVPVNIQYSQYQVMIDCDNNQNTGFISDGLGVDYMLESGQMWAHYANDSNWSFDKVEPFTYEKTDNQNGFMIKIKKDCFGAVSDSAKVLVKLIDSSWTAISDFVVITADKVSEDNNGKIQIDGFQISAINRGLRTVYSVSDTINGKNVVNVGMIYGIESPDYNAKDMFVGSDNPIVHCYTATPNGLLAGTFSLDKSYAITMQFARGTAKEYVLTYYVRAFAQLSDGQYVYSDIESYTDYNIADYVYQKCLVTN